MLFRSADEQTQIPGPDGLIDETGGAGEDEGEREDEEHGCTGVALRRRDVAASERVGDAPAPETNQRGSPGVVKISEAMLLPGESGPPGVGSHLTRAFRCTRM